LIVAQHIHFIYPHFEINKQDFCNGTKKVQITLV